MPETEWVDRDLRRFDTRGFDFGKPRAVLGCWFAIQHLVFQRWWCPNRFRIGILRCFGARVGNNVWMREGIYVHLPWRLEIGAYSQIGREVMIINHANVVLGAHVTVSQQAILSSGGHDPRSQGLDYKHEPIQLDDGVWVCARAAIGPGVSLGKNAVVGLGEVVRRKSRPSAHGQTKDAKNVD